MPVSDNAVFCPPPESLATSNQRMQAKWPAEACVAVYAVEVGWRSPRSFQSLQLQSHRSEIQCRLRNRVEGVESHDKMVAGIVVVVNPREQRGVRE